MSETTDMRQVQKRILQLTSFEDGLWDLLLGAIFVFLAIFPITRDLLGPEWNLVLFLGAVVLLAVGQLVLRYFISVPRIGFMRPRRSPKLRMFVIFTVIMVLLTLGLLLVTFLGPGSEAAPSATVETSTERGYMVELIVVLVMGGLFSAMGYFFGVPRLYFYGWLIGLANLASVYMTHNADWGFNIPLAVVAGLILLIGIVLLVRFLRKYPLRPQEA
jgi:nucleoside recognition membrane protein YjiH